MNHNHELEQKYEGMLPDAIIFAFNAHAGQYRKAQPQQYIIHPLRVSEFLLKNFGDHPELETMRVAAVLHDTIEDTWATEKDVEAQFGKKVAKLVLSLTKPEIEDKKERLNNYISILKEASDEAKIIKLADIFDNVVLSTDNNPKWKDFMIVSKEVLESMKINKTNTTFDSIKSELLKIIEHKMKQYE